MERATFLQCEGQHESYSGGFNSITQSKQVRPFQLNIYSPLLISSLRKQKTERKIGIENFFFRFEANFAMKIAQLIVNAVTFAVESLG